jgi:hypothetical protein
MKKFLGIVMVALCMLFVGCNSCSKKVDSVSNDSVIEMVKGVDVNYVTGGDISWMGMHYPDVKWHWVECCIDMKDFIDETDTCEVLAVANIFSYIEIIDSVKGTFKPYVILLAQTADTSVIEIKEGLWVGDDPMNDYTMNIDFAHAWDRMMKANCVKPHSKHCVLRKEVGPIGGLDPIYIFGNQDAQVYVMSNTGDVTTYNPVFPKDINYVEKDVNYNGTVYGPRNTRIGCPLGEWP